MVIAAFHNWRDNGNWTWQNVNEPRFISETSRNYTRGTGIPVLFLSFLFFSFSTPVTFPPPSPRLSAIIVSDERFSAPCNWVRNVIRRLLCKGERHFQCNRLTTTFQSHLFRIIRSFADNFDLSWPKAARTQRNNTLQKSHKSNIVRVFRIQNPSTIDDSLDLSLD